MPFPITMVPKFNVMVIPKLASRVTTDHCNNLNRKIWREKHWKWLQLRSFHYPGIRIKRYPGFRIKEKEKKNLQSQSLLLGWRTNHLWWLHKYGSSRWQIQAATTQQIAICRWKYPKIGPNWNPMTNVSWDGPSQCAQLWTFTNVDTSVNIFTAANIYLDKHVNIYTHTAINFHFVHIFSWLKTFCADILCKCAIVRLSPVWVLGGTESRLIESIVGLAAHCAVEQNKLWFETNSPIDCRANPTDCKD